MNLRITYLLFYLALFSCGSDVVTVTDIPVIIEPQEIYEVNVVGFTEDTQGSKVSNVDLMIGGTVAQSAEGGFYIGDKVLIGKEGSVLSVKKEGYLPLYKRVYHHQSLEDVVSVITMVGSSPAVSIPMSGSTVEIMSGADLIIAESSFDQAIALTLYGESSDDKPIDMDAFVIENERVNVLVSDVRIFIGSDADLTSESDLSLVLDKNRLSNNSTLYYYDEEKLSWVSIDQIPYTDDEHITYKLDALGWWSVGVVLPTVYGKVTINQADNSSVSHSEMQIKYVNGEKQLIERVFTDKKGELSRYYPTNTEIEIKPSNGAQMLTINSEFTKNKRNVEVTSDDILVKTINGSTYDCNLQKRGGYVSITSGSDFTIKRVIDGNFEAVVGKDAATTRLDVYSMAGSKESSIEVDITDVDELDLVDIVACEYGLQVDDGMIIYEFADCRFREKPIESFLVGENVDSQFFIAVKGNKVGEYDGLVYAESIPTLSVTNIDKEVKVEIIIYNAITKTIAGKVDGRYKNGEEYEVTFIGMIEQ